MATALRVPTHDGARLRQQSRELRAQARQACARARDVCERATALLQRTDAVATRAAGTRRPPPLLIGGRAN